MTLTAEVRMLESTDSIEDLTELLHRAYARLGNMGLNYTAVDQSIDTTRKRCAHGHCFVALIGQAIVGTVCVSPPDAGNDCLHYRDPTLPHGHQFAVDPSAQGLGVGQMLMTAVERWAIEHGYSKIGLDTAEGATHLIEMYERWGYRTIGVTQWAGKVYRSVVMVKTLRHN
jgi:GNAT superfamily N-acetyltransferase